MQLRVLGGIWVVAGVVLAVLSTATPVRQRLVQMLSLVAIARRLLLPDGQPSRAGHKDIFAGLGIQTPPATRLPFEPALGGA